MVMMMMMTTMFVQFSVELRLSDVWRETSNKFCTRSWDTRDHERTRKYAFVENKVCIV